MIIATSILRSVHKPMIDSVLVHTDLHSQGHISILGYGYYFVAEWVYIVGMNSYLDLLVN